MPAVFHPQSLPDSTIPVTVIWDNPDAEPGIETINLARDWVMRGESYVKAQLKLSVDCQILAAIPGAHKSLMGIAY